jgi:hypothetical protein
VPCCRLRRRGCSNAAPFLKKENLRSIITSPYLAGFGCAAIHRSGLVVRPRCLTTGLSGGAFGRALLLPGLWASSARFDFLLPLPPGQASPLPPPAAEQPFGFFVRPPLQRVGQPQKLVNCITPAAHAAQFF